MTEEQKRRRVETAREWVDYSRGRLSAGEGTTEELIIYALVEKIEFLEGRVARDENVC